MGRGGDSQEEEGVRKVCERPERVRGAGVALATGHKGQKTALAKKPKKRTGERREKGMTRTAPAGRTSCVRYHTKEWGRGKREIWGRKGRKGGREERGKPVTEQLYSSSDTAGCRRDWGNIVTAGPACQGRAEKQRKG